MIQYGGQSGEIKWMGLLNELEDKNLMAGIEMVWTISLSFTGSFEGIYSNTKSSKIFFKYTRQYDPTKVCFKC